MPVNVDEITRQLDALEVRPVEPSTSSVSDAAETIDFKHVDWAHEADDALGALLEKDAAAAERAAAKQQERQQDPEALIPLESGLDVMMRTLARSWPRYKRSFSSYWLGLSQEQQVWHLQHEILGSRCT